MADHDYAEELRIATEATRAAGDEVLRMRREGLRYGHKDGRELVSEADIRAAEMLHAALTSAFPSDGWLSEEHTDTAHRLGCERAWVVDPIDGTREFLMGVPEYAVSVALVVNGEPVLGVVYNPAAEDLRAAVCAGAEESPPGLLTPHFTVLVGRSEKRWNEVPPLPKGAKTSAVGSVAYRLARLASGQGDACLSGYGRSEWDVAAGVALCKAAGLRATDVLGHPMRFNQPDPYVAGLLIAKPALHGVLDQWFRRLR